MYKKKYFLKIIFDINTLKQSENIKKKISFFQKRFRNAFPNTPFYDEKTVIQHVWTIWKQIIYSKLILYCNIWLIPIILSNQVHQLANDRSSLTLNVEGSLYHSQNLSSIRNSEYSHGIHLQILP